MRALRGVSERPRRAIAQAAAWWARRSPIVRRSALAVRIVVVLSAVTAFALASGGGSRPSLVITPILPTPMPIVATATATATSTPTSAATPTPTPTPRPPVTPGPTPATTPTPTTTATAAAAATPDPTAAPGPDASIFFTLEDLHAALGEAPDATLGRIRIPVLGVDAALGQRFVSGSRMQNPTGPGDVVWYDLSLWDGLGGAPGAGGNAVFAGHVDYRAGVHWANARYHGEGVFRHLDLLAPGDVIEIEVGGVTLRYSVVWQRHVAADSSTGQILSADVDVDSITLITCGGEFNTTTRNYTERVIIRAERSGT